MLAGAIIAAAPAVASASQQDPSGTGYLELCKTFAAVPAGQQSYQGTFSYSVTGVARPVVIKAVTGGPEVCTQPFSVPSGTVTVTEGSNSWSSVANVTATNDQQNSLAWTTGSSKATVKVPTNSDSNSAVTLHYTNDPVYGVVELCKAPATNSSALTGTYMFNLTSDEPGISAYDAKTGAYDLPWTTTASATISAAGLGCSGPTTVPAGGLGTAEQGAALYVTGIGATINGSTSIFPSTKVLTDYNLSAGTADVVVEAGNTTNQTLVTYTDAISTVKLCKSWAGRDVAPPVSSFPFTATSSGPAGPTAVSSAVSVQPGTCQILGYVRAGTQVNITEGVVAGTKVATIGANQGIIPGTLSLPNRTVSVIAGPGETDVTFTDEPADPGQLKICVQPTTGATAATVPFVVNGTQMIDVNLSATAMQCTLDPSSFAFNSGVTIAGGALPSPDAFTGTPSVLPPNVEVWEGFPPVLTATNQPSLSASTASSATVLMSEGTITEVTFTIDPPAPATAPTSTSTPTAAQVTANSVDLPSQSGSSSSTPLSPAQVTAALRKQLSHVRAEIRSLQKKLSKKHLSKAARRADQRRLTQLRRLEPRILRELK